MRPRFLRELVCVTHGDRIVVDGAERPQLLEGKSVRSLLPDLIRFMDGTRTLAQLENTLSMIPQEHIRTAVSLLFNSGLIEDGSSDEEPGTLPNSETLAFCRRYSGVTGMNRSGQQACEKLQMAEVLLVGEGVHELHNTSLKSVLEKTGVGRVLLLDRAQLHSWHPGTGVAPAQSIIVSLSFGAEDHHWHAELDDWCGRHKLSWLRAVVDQERGVADLGPLFNDHENACYQCFRQMHLDAHREHAFPLQSTHVQFWTSLVATEIIYLLARIGPVATGRDFRRYNLHDWSSKNLRFTRLPGCLGCLPANSGSQSEPENIVDSAVVFEDYVCAHSLEFLPGNEKKGQAQVFAALAEESKKLPNCLQLPLNPEIPKFDCCLLDVLSRRISKARPSLGLDDLAALLLMTAGIRESNEYTKRWNATGGNLGSVELYVAVREVDGLAPGFYFYSPREHSLALFHSRRGALPVDDFMRRVSGRDSAALPQVMVLFTGAFHRVARKYSAFGYRLVNLDAGVAVSQLRLLASGLDIFSHALVRWPDDLIERLLHLRPFQEQVTAVVELWKDNPPSASVPQSSNGNSAKSTLPASQRAAASFHDVSAFEMARMVYQDSRIKEDELPAVPNKVPAALLDPPASANRIVSLPPIANGGLLLGDVVARRRSVRRYTAEPIGATEFSTMLVSAHQHDARDWPAEHSAGLPLTFAVFAWRTEDFEPGVYLYEPEQNGLRFLENAPTEEHRTRLFLQEELAVAPAVIWIFGNLAAACARHGALGHRQLLLRAGAAAHRLWMAGVSLGVGGCLMGGVIPGEARRQFGFDGYKRASLLALALGYTAQGPK